MFDNVEAAIFDLDGTLIDSMWIWDKIDIDYLTNKNIPIPENLNAEIGHLSFNQVAIYFKERFQLKDSLDEIKNCWHDMANYHYSNNIKLKKGVKEFLDFLEFRRLVAQSQHGFHSFLKGLVFFCCLSFRLSRCIL